MRILFIGAVKFSELALKKLIELKADVVAVCTKQSSAFNSDFVDLSFCCQEADIPFRYVQDVNSDDTVEWIKSINPDIIFCFGWSNLIKKQILELPELGVIGFHPAELPYNRGRHPLIWALALGLKETASTFFFMEEGADNGDILSQVKINIDYKDNAKTLYEKVSSVALNQIEDFLPKLSSNAHQRTPQNHKKSNVWRKRGKPDGAIDFRMCSYAIYNLVRALSEPYVGAHLVYKGLEIKVWQVEEIEFTQNNIEPGRIIGNDNGLIVKTYDAAVRIIRHEFIKLPETGEYL